MITYLHVDVLTEAEICLKNDNLGCYNHVCEFLYREYYVGHLTHLIMTRCYTVQQCAFLSSYVVYLYSSSFIHTYIYDRITRKFMSTPDVSLDQTVLVVNIASDSRICFWILLKEKKMLITVYMYILL